MFKMKLIKKKKSTRIPWKEKKWKIVLFIIIKKEVICIVIKPNATSQP